MARLLAILLLLLAAPGCLTFVPEGAGDDDSVGDDDDSVGDDDDSVGDDDDATAPTDADGDGVAVQDGDCDDADPDTYPGASEACDGEDDDCDGVADNGLSMSSFAPDQDGDGYTNPQPTSFVQACAPPDGFTAPADPADCVDTNAEVYPGATELCDGLDNNCNGQLDEGVRTQLYRDEDRDGYGAGGAVGLGCPGPGFATNALDCDDWSAQLNPADADGDGLSGCDGDCNDQDAAIVPGADNDGDGYAACWADCNDYEVRVFPGAPEECDGVDQNCDGLADEGLSPVAVVAGADVASADQIVQLLRNAGYCVVAPIPSGDLWSYSWNAFVGAVISYDTGDTAGFYGDPGPLWGWLWTVSASGGNPGAIVLMGSGGLSVANWLGVSTYIGSAWAATAASGDAFAIQPSNPLWRTPNWLVAASAPSGTPVTVHTQASASTWGTLGTPAGAALAWGQAGGGLESIVSDVDASGSRKAIWLWGYDLGFNLATTQGRQLFANVIYAAVGPP